MQRREDHRGVPLARRRRLDGAQRLAGLTQGDGNALVQRRCSGGVDLTEVSVHLSEGASSTDGFGAFCGRPRHPDDSSHRNELAAVRGVAIIPTGSASLAASLASGEAPRVQC